MGRESIMPALEQSSRRTFAHERDPERHVNRLTQLDTFARAGFAARGVVYLLLGYFAWTTGGGEATTTVMERLADIPAGSALLVLLAIGLAGYGLFRIYGAWIDIKGKGSDAKGLFERTGPVLSGIAHFVLAGIAVSIATAGPSTGGGGEDQAADIAMGLPGGAVLVGLAGLVGLAAGFGNFHKAWTCAYMEDLGARTPGFARLAGRAGYAARGIVFGLVGWQILALAIGWGDRDLGMEAAMESLRGRDWLFPAVAAGLGLFGLFSLVMARYAEIRNEDVVRRIRAEASRIAAR